MTVSSIARDNMVCTDCKFKIDPAALCTILGRKVTDAPGALNRFHFCSAVCWTRWLCAIDYQEWATMILPPLTDSWDIRDVKHALCGRIRKAAA